MPSVVTVGAEPQELIEPFPAQAFVSDVMSLRARLAADSAPALVSLDYFLPQLGPFRRLKVELIIDLHLSPFPALTSSSA